MRQAVRAPSASGSKAQTIPQAQKALATRLVKRDRNSLPALKLTPKSAAYTKTYFAHYELVKDAKRSATVAKEKGALNL